MKQLQLFEARSVHKRKLTRKRIERAARKLVRAAEIAANRDRVQILRTMRCPKLLSAAMPRVILKEDYLQRPRSPESEFGLRFAGPRLQRQLADFVGRSAAAGIDADVAQSEFFRTMRRDGGFGKKNAETRWLKGLRKKGNKVRRRKMIEEPLFKPSVIAAIALRDKDSSPFDKFDQDF